MPQAVDPNDSPATSDAAARVVPPPGTNGDANPASTGGRNVKVGAGISASPDVTKPVPTAETASAGEEEPEPVSLAGLFKYANSTDMLLLIGGALGGAGVGVTMPLFAVFLGGMYDDFQTGSDVLAAGEKYASLFGWLALATFAGGFAQVGFFTMLSERVTLRVRKLYLSSILRQDVSWFDTAASGELSSKIAENTVVIREGLGEKLGALFQFLTMFIAGYAVGFSTNWRLTLVVLAVAPLLAMGGFMMVKLMEESTAGGLGAYSRAGAVAEEAFTMIRAVQSYSIEGRTAKRYRKELLEAEAAGIRKAKGQGLAMGFTFMIYFLSYGLAFWYGSILVTDAQLDAAKEFAFDPSLAMAGVGDDCAVGRSIDPARAKEMLCVTNDYEDTFTFQNEADVCNCIACNCGCFREGVECAVNGGDIVLVFFSVIMASFAVGQAAPSISALVNARAAAGKIYAIIDRVPEIDASGGSGGVVLRRADVRGAYRLENVRFRYPARKEALIFDGVSLSIDSHKTTALVGGSGCGKSTVTQLLMRFYDPEAGRVTLDGRDIRELDVASLRAQMGLVGQEPVLFATSIAKNIAYGAPAGEQPTLEQIHAAARTANAFDFIMDLPEGFDTFVGERGSTLSGGQKQRIAIARALLRDPALLILDEATSALSPMDERVVQAALDKLLQQQRRTTVVIAHRLSTVRNADKIVVLGANGGGVLEEGAHDELLQRDGFYAALVAAAQRSQEQNAGEGEVDIERLMSEDHDVQARFGSATSGRVASSSFHAAPRAHSSSHAMDVAEMGESAAVKQSAVTAVDAVAGKDGKADKEPLYKVPMRRIFTYSAEEKLLYVPAMISAAVNGATMPVFAILFAGISNVYFLPTQELVKEEANSFALMFVGLSAAVGLCYWGQFRYFGIIGERMTTRVRFALFSALLRQEVGFYDMQANSVGALTSKLSTDAAVVKAAIVDRLGLVVMNLVTMVAGLAIAFYYGWKLTLVLLALLPLIVLAGAFQMLVMGGLAHEDDKALAGAGQVLSESIAGIRTVTAFDLRVKVVALYDDFLAGPSSLAVKKGLTGGLAFGFSQGVLFAVYSVAFFYGSRLIDDGEYTFQDMINVFFAVVMLGFGVGNSMGMAPDVAKASVGISNVFRVLDRKSKIDPSDVLAGLQPETTSTEDIVFRGVDFSYPTRPDAAVYTGMDLHVPGGKVVALVGASGSGKSTCVSLVERFYDANAGSITVRGVDVKQANVAWLRQQIGLVQQEGQLFATTVFANIAYGVPPAPGVEDGDDQLVTQEMVEAAARKANAHDFIMEFPDGYQTLVGPQGSQLSGGQRQRICLARCLIRRPKVLLLDESTSALDNESERVVQEALDKMIDELKCTTLVVAHRLTTIMHADRIVVFSHGVPVEAGTHDELLAKDAAYAALWRAQMGQHADDDK